MKPETEIAVRGVLMMDADITKENVERALDVLRGKADGEEIIIHNVRFEDAIDILKVSRRTLRHYLDTGYLDRVYGGGCRAIGVSRESLLRFMSRRTVEHRDRDGKTFRHGKACEVPGRPWARELKK
ncbi:MAG: hypothetical protein II840_09760 [Kiritimatiellae bacterium]|nr:hypothetical protein [Kiritimatiellia bacterium]